MSSLNYTQAELAAVLSQPGYGLVGDTAATPTPQQVQPGNGTTGNKQSAVSLLLQQIELAGLAAPVTEYRFHPTRQWRADLAWPDRRLLVEIEGGIWLQTSTGRGKGHAHPERFVKDIEKYNTATVMGFRLLRFTPDMVEDETAVSVIMEAI